MHVWVHSSSHITAAALAELVRARGFSSSTRWEPASEVALWDLSGAGSSGDDPGGRAPPFLRTLALVGDEAAGVRAFGLGCHGYLTRRAGGAELERALLAVAKGQAWAGDRPLSGLPSGFNA